MNILVIGSGGREHTLAWKLAQSPKATKLYAVPGNPGMADVAECIGDVDICDNEARVKLAEEKAIDLVVVGPEVPLTRSSPRLDPEGGRPNRHQGRRPRRRQGRHRRHDT